MPNTFICLMLKDWQILLDCRSISLLKAEAVKDIELVCSLSLIANNLIFWIDCKLPTKLRRAIFCQISTWVIRQMLKHI